LSKRCDEAALQRVVPVRYTALRSSCKAAGSQPGQEGGEPGSAQAGSSSGRRPAGVGIGGRLLADHQRGGVRRSAPARVRHGRGGRLCCAGELACVACAHQPVQLTLLGRVCLDCLETMQMAVCKAQEKELGSELSVCLKQGGRTRRRRKPQPEKPPPMMSPIKSLFASNRLGHLSGMLLPALGSSSASASLLQPGAPAKLGGFAQSFVSPALAVSAPRADLEQRCQH
jgi:hypothetical protein